MDTRDREAIEGLFAKLGDVERQAGPRDAEAEGFISERVARLPGAPYYMAQTIVMQDLALANQQSRIEELERQLAGQPRQAQAASEGGFLSRILGGAAPSQRPMPGENRAASGPWGSSQAGNSAPPAYGQAASPQGQAPYGQPQQGFGQQAYGRGGFGGGGMGGGFLAGAAQTAMGVAGGVLLGNAIGGMFGGHEATAAETPAPDADATAGADAPADDASAAEPASDTGGWFGGDDSGGGFEDI